MTDSLIATAQETQIVQPSDSTGMIAPVSQVALITAADPAMTSGAVAPVQVPVMVSQINNLVAQITALPSNPFVSNADIVALKANLIAWLAEVQSNGGAPAADNALINTGVTAAPLTISKYAAAVAAQNKKIFVYGGAALFIIILALIVKK